MESSGHNRANISPPNCNKMLIFGKEAFLIMAFSNILTNLVISNVTSHFRTLFKTKLLDLAFKWRPLLCSNNLINQ